ncbi:MAG: HAD-IIA family hydrolase [Anaerolineales bacterium]|nr:HAD-IIA family hydrolase [Anaerolineales bacterium]
MLTSPTPIRALILDMDGVLWRDQEPIGNLPAIFSRIAARGLRVILATNNATRSVASYLQKLAEFGVTIEPWQIITSSQATAQHLKTQYPEGGPVFVVGETGLIETLREKGFTLSSDASPVHTVVAAMDRYLSYEKLAQATLLIRAGATFIGTNPDRSFPTPAGLVPGAGSILALLETASDISPIIIGKPGPIMYQQALERLNTSPEETLAVGDRLETDILGGQNTNCKTALVLSGVTTLEQAQAWHPEPDWIAPDLTTLLEQIL